MVDYTKLTKAQIIEKNEQLQKEIQSLEQGSESNKILFDKEIIKIKGLLGKSEKEVEALKVTIERLKNDPEKSNIKERLEDLKTECFNKERNIRSLEEQIVQKDELLKETIAQRDENLQHVINKKDVALKEIVNQKDEQIKFLSTQLNGLSDLFNEIFVGLKDQNALLGVYSRNINNFQERIDAKIAQFNTPPTEKK